MAQTSVDFANSNNQHISIIASGEEKNLSTGKKNVTLSGKYGNDLIISRELSIFLTFDDISRYFPEIWWILPMRRYIGVFSGEFTKDFLYKITQKIFVKKPKIMEIPRLPFFCTMSKP